MANVESNSTNTIEPHTFQVPIPITVPISSESSVETILFNHPYPPHLQQSITTNRIPNNTAQTPALAQTHPLLILLPGSSATHETFHPLIPLFPPHLPVLLYNRTTSHPLPSAHELLTLLTTLDCQGPYILLAHSYGGAIARAFLHIRSEAVAALIFIETGQETPAGEWSDQQFRKRVMQERPVVVIKGDTLHGLKTRNQQESQGNQTITTEITSLMRKWECKDRKLKRRQLCLSWNSKWVEVAGVGHGVVGERPDVVITEGVDWVLEELARQKRDRGKWWGFEMMMMTGWREIRQLGWEVGWLLGVLGR